MNPSAVVRFVCPFHERVAQDGPDAVAVSHIEEKLNCHDCDVLHYQLHRDDPNGESDRRLVDDWEAAYALAIVWLPAAVEYWGRRVAEDPDDERNEAWRFENKHEAVFWLLETP